MPLLTEDLPEGALSFARIPCARLPCIVSALAGLFASLVGASLLLSVTSSSATNSAFSGSLVFAELSDAVLSFRKKELEAELARLDSEIKSRAQGELAIAAQARGMERSQLVVEQKLIGLHPSETSTTPMVHSPELFLDVRANPNLWAAGAVVCVVIIFSTLSICWAEDETAANIPPASSKLDRPDLWNNRKDMVEFIKRNLKAESFADLSCSALLLNRPWRVQQGPPIMPDKVTSNVAWMAHESRKPRVFPNGHEDLDNMWGTVLAFWAFLWKKKRPYKCICLMVLEGVCIPMLAQILGWLLGEVNSNGSAHNLLKYCIMLFGVNLVYNRAEYIYEVDVPGASVRYELTYRLHKQFLGMQGDLAQQWPAGRCSAMLSYDVVQAVNLNWESIFALVKCTTSLIMCTIIMIHNTGVGNPRVRGACIIIFVSLFVGTILVTWFREANCLDLANRKRDWQLAWMAISTMQVRQTREGIRFNRDEAAQEVSDAAMVFRKRAFHYFFIRLVATLAPAQMSFFAEAVVALLAGLSAIRGDLSTGEAAALIAVVKLLTTELKAWVNVLLNIIEGYSSLVEICEVFNEDVDDEPDDSPHTIRASTALF